MFDLVAGKDGYLIDQTRILSIGPLPAELVRAYKVALEIHFELEEMIAPGVLAGDLFSRHGDRHGTQVHIPRRRRDRRGGYIYRDRFR